MSKKFFTADWHSGEAQKPNTHSYLRPRPTEVMILEWVDECHKKIKPEDTFYFVGDLAILLDDLKIYQRLPSCQKILILGDKEYASKHFSKDECLQRIKELGIFDEIHENITVEIGGHTFFVSHKPSDCLKQDLPSICGHIHGIWRTSEMPNKQPIINVGIDAWGGLVSEEFIIHQYNAVTAHYDDNAFPGRW